MTVDVQSVTAGATILLPDAPPVTGLRFRHYRGPQDHAEMARVANASWADDGETRVQSAEELDNEYANPVNMDPYQDVIVAEVDGTVVGFGRVDWVNQNWGGRSYGSWGAVDPAWRRRGIGRALMRHNERRLHQIGDAQSYDGPRWLTTWGSDQNAGLRALVEQEGFVAVRHFFLMVRPNLYEIPDVPLPTGIEVHPIVNAQLRQVFDADVEAFQDHWGGVENSDENFKRWIGAPRFDPSLIVIGWDGDQIAGGVVNGIYDAENERLGIKRGFLDSVFTRRAWRRRGLARALISRSLVLLRERGMTMAALGVDASNPSAALPLYQSCGFEAAEADTAYRKPWDPAKGREWEQVNEPAF